MGYRTSDVVCSDNEVRILGPQPEVIGLWYFSILSKG